MVAAWVMGLTRAAGDPCDPWRGGRQKSCAKCGLARVWCPSAARPAHKSEVTDLKGLLARDEDFMRSAA